MKRVAMAALAIGAATSQLVAFGCLPGAGPPLNVYEDDAGGAPALDLTADSGIAPLDVNVGASFALVGVSPSHGPFSGGNRAVLRGRGFHSRIAISFGGTDVAAENVLATDPTSVAVTVPPGSPGFVDVRVRDLENGNEAILRRGYVYEALRVEPATGATAGGTRVEFIGYKTAWNANAKPTIDGRPCTDVSLIDSEHFLCTTPSNNPGSKGISVDTAGTVVDARDAFTYSDAPDGFRGGLSGGVINGQLRVIAFDAWTSAPLAGAKIVVSRSPSPIVATANASGVATISDPSLSRASKPTVTVAAKCHNPVTFADVPVDTLVTYQTPVLDPDCGDGDPPSGGNFGVRNAAVVEGELIWPEGIEFKRGGWANVPYPSRPSERLAAYVFAASGNPQAPFGLPAPDAATTPESPGRNGYAYSITLGPGNLTLYALAGIEDRSQNPPAFTAYAMGLVRGIPAEAGVRTTGVDLVMNVRLDHALTFSASPPAPSRRGPDRLVSRTAIALGASNYAVLPNAVSTVLLPAPQSIRLVGVPALDHALSGSRYAVSSAAVTGTQEQSPLSALSLIQTSESNEPISLQGFLSIPTLLDPTAASWSRTALRVQSASAYDLAVTQIESGGGLVTWTIVAPNGVANETKTVLLPDLDSLGARMGLVHGVLRVTAQTARIERFEYGRLRNGQLASGTWSAYAADAFTTHF